MPISLITPISSHTGGYMDPLQSVLFLITWSTRSGFQQTSVYAKTYNLMAKQKWCAPTYDCACVCMYYTSTHNNIVYVRITIHVPCPTQDNGFFSFSKCLKRFCSTLLLHTATMVETSRMPHFSFWNESYRFAPNSKFHSATKDREMDERVELSWRKYSRRRIWSQNIASLVAKVQSLLWLTA